MKNFYPHGHVMPGGDGSGERSPTQQVAVPRTQAINLSTAPRTYSLVKFNSYRKRGKAGSPPATTSNPYNVLKKVDWLAIFSPWAIINRSKRYTNGGSMVRWVVAEFHRSTHHDNDPSICATRTPANNAALKGLAIATGGTTVVPKIFSGEFFGSFFAENHEVLMHAIKKQSLMHKKERPVAACPDRSGASDGKVEGWKNRLKRSKTFHTPFPSILHLLLPTIFVSVFICFSGAAKAQSRQDVGTAEVVKPLQIGDTIPEELWKKNLIVLSQKEGHTDVTLDDYRDAVIVLDFWGTWCSICIKEFPKLFELKGQFDSHDVFILPVVNQSEAVVRSTMERTTIKSIPDFATVLDDGYLVRLFPAEEYPHIVVLNDGKVTAITKPEYLDTNRLTSLSNGKAPYMPAKVGMEEVRNKSLLVPAYKEFHQYKPVYYSSLMGFQDGLTATLLYERNETHTRFMIPNTDLWLMYEQAYGFKGDQRMLEISVFPNRRIVLLDRPERYFDWRPISQYPEEERSSIMKNYYYTYDALMPPSMDKQQARRELAEDLDKYLDISTSLETLSVNCLVLYALDETVKYSANSRSKGYRMARYLNHPTYKLPPVVCSDELSSQVIDRIKLEERPYELSELNLLLRPYGLILRQETRMLDMFVVRNADERHYAFDLAILQLGKYGYEKGVNP